MKPRFAYDIGAITARVSKIARSHAALCKAEIVTLRAEVERLRHENAALKARCAFPARNRTTPP